MDSRTRGADDQKKDSPIMTATYASARLRTIRATPVNTAHVRCANCGLVFASAEAMRAHRAEVTKTTAPGPCLSPSTMLTTGWRIGTTSRSEQTWSPPKLSSVRRPTEAEADAGYTCSLCKRTFADLEGFQAHHIHNFTAGERCLEADELRALDFVERRSGIWARDIATQSLASQIGRLATVRPPLFDAPNIQG
jgi:hypothetical protein